jgi:hypothetical protein
VGLPFYANDTLPGEDESVGGNWRHGYKQLNIQLRRGWEASFQFLANGATHLGRAISREVKAETDLDSEAYLRLQTLNPWAAKQEQSRGVSEGAWTPQGKSSSPQIRTADLKYDNNDSIYHNSEVSFPNPLPHCSAADMFSTTRLAAAATAPYNLSMLVTQLAALSSPNLDGNLSGTRLESGRRFLDKTNTWFDAMRVTDATTCFDIMTHYMEGHARNWMDERNPSNYLNWRVFCMLFRTQFPKRLSRLSRMETQKRSCSSGRLQHSTSTC